MTHRWSPYLLSAALNAGTLAYLATEPHSWYTRALPLAIVMALVKLDRPGRTEHQTVPRREAAFAAILLGVAGLHLANVVLLVRVLPASIPVIDRLMAVFLVGTGSAYSAVVVAHELVHRRPRPAQALGRLLLTTALYDHFFVEHVRGHHVRVGTADDPSTARFGETFWHYARRSVPRQFVAAWRLDRGSIATGVLMEGAVVAATVVLGGWWAFAGFVLQALWATLLVTGVNYFEHWGLRRMQRRITEADAW
jgi:alkane 1-monooxygenase